MVNTQQKANLVEVKYADPLGYLNMNSSSPSATPDTAAGKSGGQELDELLVVNLHK